MIESLSGDSISRCPHGFYRAVGCFICAYQNAPKCAHSQPNGYRCFDCADYETRVLFEMLQEATEALERTDYSYCMIADKKKLSSYETIQIIQKCKEVISEFE